MTHVAVSGMSLGCIWCVSGVYLGGRESFVSCTASSLFVMAKIRRIGQPPFFWVAVVVLGGIQAVTRDKTSCPIRGDK